MSEPNWWQSAIDAFRGPQRKATIILLLSPPLLITWKVFGSHQFYLERLAGRWDGMGDPTAAAALYTFLASLFLLGVVPALIVKLVFRERLADYGVRLGDCRRGMRSFLILAPIFVAIAYVGARDAAIAVEYPINKSAGASPGAFGLHACTYALAYLGWEFYFRGFMQMGLRPSMGQVNALLVQVLASVLVHIGKPTLEIYGSIGGGILWGMLAYRTRSLLSGMMQHFLMGLAVDWFVCYG